MFSFRRFVVVVFVLNPLLAVAGDSWSRAPTVPLLRYQQTLTDPSGAPISGTHVLTLSIHDARTVGATLWSETRSVILDGGRLDLLLGVEQPLPRSLPSSAPLWIEVSADGRALAPRTRMSAEVLVLTGEPPSLPNSPDRSNGPEDTESWIGKHVDELIAEFGEPTRVKRRKSGERVLIYKTRIVGGVAANPKDVERWTYDCGGEMVHYPFLPGPQQRVVDLPEGSASLTACAAQGATPSPEIVGKSKTRVRVDAAGRIQDLVVGNTSWNASEVKKREIAADD